MSDDSLPDFVDLKKRYMALPPGPKAEIRRVRDPDELAMIPAVYRLLPPGQRLTDPWQRVLFLLPYVRHRDGEATLGQALAHARISEMRVFQMIRSEDQTIALQHLRRLCQHVEPTVNWQQFGRTLFFWGDKARQRIVEDYFISGGGKSPARQTKEKA